MPTDRRLRTLAAACLALASLLAVAAGPASALEPPRPLPDHRARFVTQTDVRPWKDCLWASAAMLLDKWTNGDVVRTHRQLRTLSRDRRGGSTFRDLHLAFARLGFAVPDDRAGHRLTWGQLLARLRRGAGAIVLGDYGHLPRWYGRWDVAFWSSRPRTAKERKALAAALAEPGAPKPKPRPDNHAVYVERYDAKRGRVWLMDPLARGDWRGEWISVRSLKRFAWTSGGRVVAVTTPIAAPRPFAGVRFTDPAIGMSTEAVTASWRVSAPSRWRYPGGDLRVSMKGAPAPLEAAVQSALLEPGVTTDAAPPKPRAGIAENRLALTAALPATPGAYLASMSLTDRRFGRLVVSSRPVALFVPGERRALLRLNVNDSVLMAGGSVRLNVSAANNGEATWADQRDTRLTATWIRIDGPTGGASDAATGTHDLLPVPLEPGELARYHGALRVPETPGRWALVVDVVDAVAGSYAALGSRPDVALFDVVPARGISPVE